MTEQYRNTSNVDLHYRNTTMDHDIGPKKSLFIVVVVVGCFAVLWPNVFHPMIVGTAEQHIKPSAIDKPSGCCYVLSETDINTIEIMSELCKNIIKEQFANIPLNGKQIINICQNEVLNTCGIDISRILQEHVRLGYTTKQIIDEIRSLNGSLCLKYNFHIPPWRLGVPHIVMIKNLTDIGVYQERSAKVRSEMVHPAFREKGSAIPLTKPIKKIIDGRPGPIPGMRPTIGHGITPQKQASGSMGIIMPIYTIGIVIFFTYTLMKIIFKKHPDTDNTIYSMEHDVSYQNTRNAAAVATKIVVNAMSALLDEVDQELEARQRSTEFTMQEDIDQTPNIKCPKAKTKYEDKSSVKVLGMELSESCDGGKKWQSTESSVLSSAASKVLEEITPPKEILLNKTLLPESQILVADSAVETEMNTEDDPPVILSGKMTLSVISLDSENLRLVGNKYEDVVENIKDEVLQESKPNLGVEIDEIIEQAKDALENKTEAESNFGIKDLSYERKSGKDFNVCNENLRKKDGEKCISSNDENMMKASENRDETEKNHLETQAKITENNSHENKVEFMNPSVEGSSGKEKNIQFSTLNRKAVVINGINPYNGISESAEHNEECSDDEIQEENENVETSSGSIDED